MIDTASFITPSPNIKENIFGYSSYLTIDTAAIVSVQQSSEHISRISIGVKVKYSYSPVVALYFCINPPYMNANEIMENTLKQTMVPTRPNNMI